MNDSRFRCATIALGLPRQGFPLPLMERSIGGGDANLAGTLPLPTFYLPKDHSDSPWPCTWDCPSFRLDSDATIPPSPLVGDAITSWALIVSMSSRVPRAPACAGITTCVMLGYSYAGRQAGMHKLNSLFLYQLTPVNVLIWLLLPRMGFNMHVMSCSLLLPTLPRLTGPILIEWLLPRPGNTIRYRGAAVMRTLFLCHSSMTPSTTGCRPTPYAFCIASFMPWPSVPPPEAPKAWGAHFTQVTLQAAAPLMHAACLAAWQMHAACGCLL